MTKFLALSIVAPHGKNIAEGRKTIEVRSWMPPRLPLRDVLIVENSVYLTQEGQIDPEGVGVALVDIDTAEPWRPSQVEATCSAGWQPGFFAWQLVNVRPLPFPQAVLAARKFYEVELDL
ncbi:ASCH domain-containing protein [Comamonadaceae bacterium PP-2]